MKMYNSQSIALNDILTGDQGAFSYLFPYRKRVPSIGKHLFTDLKSSGKKTDEYIIDKMLDLDYIGWTAKAILNIDLFPIQIAILQILWKTPFPMLVASRGGSKSYILAVYSILKALLDPGSKIVIVGAGLRQAKLVFGYLENIWNSSPILRNIVGGGKNAGPRQNVDLCYFKIGPSIITALPLGDGCASADTMITYDNCFGTISDDQPNNILTKNIIKRNTNVWGNGSFNLSDESYCNGKQKTKKIKTRKGFEIEGTFNHKLKILRDKQIVWLRMDELKTGDNILLDKSYRWHNGQTNIMKEEAYAIGLLIGDGCFTNEYRIGFATRDEELSNAIKIIGKFNQNKSDIAHWVMNGKQIKNSILDKFGIDVNLCRTKDKQFPKQILKSSREITSAFISGLFDTDGCVSVKEGRGLSIQVSFYNTSKILIEQLQYILLHYGIISSIRSTKRNEKWERCYELSITGKDILIFAREIGFKLKRKQDKLLLGIKNKKRWMNQVDPIPYVLDDMIDICSKNRIKKGKKKHINFTCSRLQKLKIASRDKVKQFLDMYDDSVDGRIGYIRCLADNDIYYDEITSIKDSECITFDIHIPDTHEYTANGFYSHNSKIRGFRATTVVCDEFACLDKNTLIETNNGLERISDITDIHTNVINRYGDFEEINKFITTPKTDIYEVSTKYGYSFKCSNIHKVLTIDGWKFGKDLTHDDFLIIKNKYIFPNNQVDNFITENIAWLMGLLIAEGDVTHKHYIGITTTDINLVKRFTMKFIELNPRVYTTRAYIDKRGWKCKERYEIRINNTLFREKLYLHGINYVDVYKKSIPSTILKSPKNIVISFLSGLFEGDGSCFLWKDRSKTKLGVEYYTVSDVLAQDVQTLLLKLDIICSRQTRDSKISDKKQWMLRCNGRYALQLAKLLNIQKWNNILSESQTYFHSDDYCIAFDKNRDKWMARVNYGGKIHNLGRYLDKKDALKIVEDFFISHDPCIRVEKVLRLPYQDHLYDFYLPKTHSFYGNGFVQHNSVPEDIFDIVVRGFTATAKSPVDEAKRIAINKKIEELGLPQELKKEMNQQKIKGNQIIYAGTAYYQFNHFAKKFNMWKEIITAKNDMKKIAEIFGGANNIPDNFDTKDYALIRLPSDYLPDGLLDKKQLAHAKATLPKNIYNMEYNALFIADSDGHFARSLIEACTVKPGQPIMTSDGEVAFVPMMKGINGRKYIMGIDPASEVDRFAITILEAWKNHYRIVYCWSINKPEFNRDKKAGLTQEGDYYDYLCAKIRNVVKLFNPIRIEMDSQGGGYPISEMLRSKKGLDKEKGEFPIYEVVDSGNIRETDNESDGPHILNLVQQSNEFNAYANAILHKSLETRRLLFPAFDTVVMQAALIAEKSLDITTNTFEECVYNLEELKNELCTIQRSQTSTGKERFDTPTSVTSAITEGRYKKGRLRKDRYTSLLLAHKYIYAMDVEPESSIDYTDTAGNFRKIKNVDPNMALYTGAGIAGFKNADEWMKSNKIKSATKNGENI